MKGRRPWNVGCKTSESVTIETFPGAGSGMAKKDIANLINEIINRILKLYQGQDPNE
jgi:hypothetical protein